MNILHLIGGDLSGGAARGAYNLHQGLLQAGASSKILFNGSPVDDPDIVSWAATPIGKMKRIFRTRMDRLPLELFYPNRGPADYSPGLFGYNVVNSPLYDWADLINLHWINWGSFDVNALKNSAKPIVWTLRDMWPMTGGCHYALDCSRYEHGCGQCPQISSSRNYDLTRYLAARKKKGLPKHFHGVGISPWISQCALNSDIMNGQEISTIFNAIDTDSFFPVDKLTARKLLGLPLDKDIVLFGSISNDLYKGGNLLFEALHLLDEKELPILNIAVGSKGSRKHQFDLKYMGYLHDDISLRLVYSAADVFVAASRAEAFGKMLAEAMACGTPVVAFDATGPKNIVLHKETGYLATPFLSQDLAKGIEWVLDDKARADKLGENSRKHAEKNFSLSVVTQQYVRLYKDLLSISRPDHKK